MRGRYGTLYDHAVIRADKMHVVVLLGDPRLPYPYNLTNRYEARDFAAVESLKRALAQHSEYAFTYVDDHARMIESLSDLRPAFVFNRCDTGYRNDAAFGAHVAHLLEILDLPYTGPDAKTFVLCESKHLINLIAGAAGVAVPAQRLIPLGESIDVPQEPYPALVKPSLGYGSIGVSADSVVTEPQAARRVLKRLRDELGFGFAVLDEYLPGPEYSAAMVGNATSLELFPPLELDYSKLPGDMPRILPYEAKVDPQSVYWTHVELRPAELSEEHREVLERYCRLAFERLGCHDHARFDFRCDADGQPRLIDVNPGPSWYPGGMFASMAGYAGYDYAAFLKLLLETGRERIGL